MCCGRGICRVMEPGLKDRGDSYSRPQRLLRVTNLSNYTYLQNKRMRRCGVPPPPPPSIIFERLKLPQQIIYRRKENLSESPNHQKYWENILLSRFYEQFSRNRRNLGHFRKFEKISNSQNMNILYIILKHVIWRFQIYNLFREIFKFLEDKSNNVFCEIRKCFRKTAKFEFIGLSDKFSFRRYIICWGNLSLSKIIGGGGGAPRTAASFYSANMCIALKRIPYSGTKVKIMDKRTALRRRVSDSNSLKNRK